MLQSKEDGLLLATANELITQELLSKIVLLMKLEAGFGGCGRMSGSKTHSVFDIDVRKPLRLVDEDSSNTQPPNSCRDRLLTPRCITIVERVMLLPRTSSDHNAFDFKPISLC